MIIATHGILASAGGIVYDADAQAFFDRVTTAGGSLSTTEKTAVNTLVIDLKGYSIWTKMTTIYPMVGASAAACAQNLKSSSFTGTFSSGWTYSSGGVTGNGTSAYLDSNLLHNSLSQNSTHISYYSRTNAYTNSQDIGVGNDSTSFLIMEINRDVAGGIQSTIVNSNSRTGATSQGNKGSLGFYIGSRTASNSQKFYKNGTSIQTSTANSTSLLNQNIYINAYNGPNGAKEFSNKQCAFASIGDGLNDTESGNLYTAVQAFQTTLARQV
jgi:hypothetical protein